MQTDKQNVLSGENNNRIDKSTPIHKEDTAAWNETDKITKVSKVSIPSGSNIANAKEWVDDGSRL